MSKKTFVIVGASLAGARAAGELRERGFDGRLVLVGAETEHPYERPPLTKDYLRGESERAKAYVHDENFYASQDIELRLGDGVAALEGEGSVTAVRTERGRRLPCDFAVVGIGVIPRVGLAQTAGLTVDNGIQVDASLRASAPGVFAAGDVANAWHPF